MTRDIALILRRVDEHSDHGGNLKSSDQIECFRSHSSLLQGKQRSTDCPLIGGVAYNSGSGCVSGCPYRIQPVSQSWQLIKMSGSEDDEDLKRAIALSLQGSEVPGSTDIINLDSDDETSSSTGKDVSSQMAGPDAATVISMLGLNRKAMEEERLLRKRKASISPPPRKARRSATAELAARGPNAQKQVPDAITHERQAGKPMVSNTPNKPSLLRPQYPQGTVKKTWAHGHTRDNSDIKLEEVLQPDSLTLAVLSSFQWEVDWLLQKLNTERTQVG